MWCSAPSLATITGAAARLTLRIAPIALSECTERQGLHELGDIVNESLNPSVGLLDYAPILYLAQLVTMKQPPVLALHFRV